MSEAGFGDAVGRGIPARMADLRRGSRVAPRPLGATLQTACCVVCWVGADPRMTASVEATASGANRGAIAMLDARGAFIEEFVIVDAWTEFRELVDVGFGVGGHIFGADFGRSPPTEEIRNGPAAGGREATRDRGLWEWQPTAGVLSPAFALHWSYLRAFVNAASGIAFLR